MPARSSRRWASEVGARWQRTARFEPRAARLIWAAAALAAAGRGADAAAEPRTHQVSIEAMQFSPQTITAAPGDTVVWTNGDAFAHTATAQDKRFDSGEIAAGRSWTLVARQPGTFEYVCTYHPTMKATLVVK